MEKNEGKREKTRENRRKNRGVEDIDEENEIWGKKLRKNE